jgi:hypothetical protein
VNVADFTAPTGYVPAKPPRPAANPMRQRKGHFIRGPLPMAWFAVAARLGGHTLHVALLLWYRAGMEGHSHIMIPRQDRDAFGVSRHALARALKGLESAGLVTVTRAQGRSPRVTICSCPDTSIQTAPQSPPEAPWPLGS